MMRLLFFGGRQIRYSTTKILRKMMALSYWNMKNILLILNALWKGPIIFLVGAYKPRSGVGSQGNLGF